MKLSEISAAIGEIKQTLSSLVGDKNKATADALNALSAKVTNLESGSAAELAAVNTKLDTANQTLATSSTAVTDLAAVNVALKAACKNLNLQVKDGATNADMITALENGVSGTLAKLNVKAEAIPAAKPSATSSDKKTATVAEWRKMNPGEAMLFFKNGGKLVD